MTKRHFKKRLFWFLIGSKVFLLLFLFVVIAGGITSNEKWTAAALMIPLLAAYIRPLWKEISDDPEQAKITIRKEGKVLKKTFVQVAHIAFVLYVIAIATVLFMFMDGSLFQGDGSIEALSADRTGSLAAALSAIESIFGLYLGPVIAALTAPVTEKDNQDQTGASHATVEKAESDPPNIHISPKESSESNREEA